MTSRFTKKKFKHDGLYITYIYFCIITIGITELKFPENYFWKS